jgi:hypothetical protein
MLPPRPLLAAALLLVGVLAWSVSALPAPVSSLASVARWEGQSVTVEGWVQDLRVLPDGVRLVLVDGGHALAVRAPAEAVAAHAEGSQDSPGGGDADASGRSLQDGDRARATGRLGRWQGRLSLDVETAGGLHRVADERPGSPSWPELAARPAGWEGRPILVRGLVDDGALHGPGGHSVALGSGPWPRDGNVQVRGFLRADPACLCHRLDAREVWPWTP